MSFDDRDFGKFAHPRPVVSRKWHGSVSAPTPRMTRSAGTSQRARITDTQGEAAEAAPAQIKHVWGQFLA
eukprot:6210562-Pleurochrysis_carterae.AAC.9